MFGGGPDQGDWSMKSDASNSKPTGTSQDLRIVSQISSLLVRLMYILRNSN